MYLDSRNTRPTRLVIAVLAALTLLCVTQTASAQVQAEADTTADQGTGEAGYDGDFFFESADENFRLEIGGRVQTLYEIVLADEGSDLDLTQSRFLIRRARLKLQGHAFTPRLTYVLQPDMGRGGFDLLDFYVNYAFAPGTFEGTTGQWRLPFLRSEINSSGRLLLVDRSLVTDVFGEGFDVGVAAHNGYRDAPTFAWVVGVFNGTKTDLGVVTVDDPDAPTLFMPSVVARISYNYGGIDPYREGDLDKGPLRFSVGASGLSQLGIERDGQSAMKATVDYVLKARGFSTSGAFMLGTAQDGDGLTDQNLFVTGLYVQAGYLIGEMIQPAARYSRVDYEGDGDLVHEALGGINVYFYGHSLKWQTDMGAIVTETPNDTDTAYRARTQLQLSF